MMYTHARQFPHLTGKSDPEIREIALRGMRRHPVLIRLMHWRNRVVLIGMVVAATLLARFTRIELGIILMLVGGASTLLVLLWNVVWLNRVLFRLTREEIERISMT